MALCVLLTWHNLDIALHILLVKSQVLNKQHGGSINKYNIRLDNIMIYVIIMS